MYLLLFNDVSPLVQGVLQYILTPALTKVKNFYSLYSQFRFEVKVFTFSVIL